jgi:hypothetical protein
MSTTYAAASGLGFDELQAIIDEHPMSWGTSHCRRCDDGVWPCGPVRRAIDAIDMRMAPLGGPLPWRTPGASRPELYRAKKLMAPPAGWFGASPDARAVLAGVLQSCKGG